MHSEPHTVLIAPMFGVTKYVDTAVVGYLMEKEIAFLGNAVNNPERPFVAILGRSKVSSKISVIDNLIDKVDVLIIGGGMAYTFLKQQATQIGDSLLEMDYLDYANKMKEKAAAKGVKLLLPVDNVVADAFSNDANTQVVPAGQIPDGWERSGYQMETAKLFADAVKTAKTVVWNEWRWDASRCRILQQEPKQLQQHWLKQMQLRSSAAEIPQQL